MQSEESVAVAVACLTGATFHGDKANQYQLKATAFIIFSRFFILAAVDRSSVRMLPLGILTLHCAMFLVRVSVRKTGHPGEDF
jgi:hypothetical protein